ncbi:UNVERIFIED_CONTAM: hypothetical protein FKN15_055405 [Acipenser sinensis]
MFTDSVGNSEDAIDQGGPTREFLTHTMQCLKSSKLFEGSDNSKNSKTCDSQAMREDEYFLAGTVMAVSLVHGGPVPNFVLKNLDDSTAYGLQHSKPTIRDISDPEIILLIKEMENAATLLTLKNCNILHLAGCLCPVKSLEDRQLSKIVLIGMSLGVHRIHWKEESTTVSFKQILSFVTGADKKPPLGFQPPPCISFLHEINTEGTVSKFPEANTCCNILKLPILSFYVDFKKNMDFGILSSPGFGQA